MAVRMLWACAGFLAAMFFALVAWEAVSFPEDKIVFLDVGQGDSILVQNGTQQVLIDGGEGTAVMRRLAEEMPWFDRVIEVVILTHPDRDHLEGLLHVMDYYDVGLVILPRITHTTQLQEAWLRIIQEAMESNGVSYRFAWAGQQLYVYDFVITILGPTERTIASAKGPNDASVISRIDARGLSFLLTGDAEMRSEQELVAGTASHLLDVDVIKAGHHGSNTSTHMPLLRAASPGMAVISVGADNRYGHPHPDVLGRLSRVPVLRTDLHGSVQFAHRRGAWHVMCRAERLLYRRESCMKQVGIDHH